MPINPDAVGETGGPVTRSWTSKDALLYAVGIGAGTDELRFTTENTRGVALSHNRYSRPSRSSSAAAAPR